jgi:PIN domain nuclease of toxin-antitoxin system
VVVPSIVLLECMYVCEKKRIEFEFQEIMQKIQGTFNYPVYPLDEEVILECQSIRQIAEVHDRIIVATAKLLNAKLITRDANITDSKIVETIW